MSQIKHFLSDVDGVLTDGGMYYSENGDELKKFCVYDGMAFVMMREKGIKVGILTAEDRDLNRRRALKLSLDYDFHSVKDKLGFIEKFCEKNHIDMREIAYIGDDRNDYHLLKKVGLAACPCNAIEEIKSIPGIHILKKKGGDGAVREFVNKVLNIPNI